jgi:hypothetical protein
MRTHFWNAKYSALYSRTYRILYDAGINEKLADELATQRTLAAALVSVAASAHVSRLDAPPSVVPA